MTLWIMKISDTESVMAQRTFIITLKEFHHSIIINIVYRVIFRKDNK